MKITIAFLTFISLFICSPAYKSAESVSIKEIDYVDGIYYHHDKIFNGDIVDYYENESLKFRYTVLDGRLHGLAKEFFFSGKLKSERNYFISKLFGQFTEYFETGEIKTQFDAKLNAYGQGEIVENITVGELKKGKYKSKSYSDGIIYFISKSGELYSTSEEISILKQTSYKIMDKENKKVLIQVD